MLVMWNSRGISFELGFVRFKKPWKLDAGEFWFCSELNNILVYCRQDEHSSARAAEPSHHQKCPSRDTRTAWHAECI
jgi:hypothetical protein